MEEEEPSLCANILNFFGYGAGPININKQEYLNRLFLITCSVGNVKMVQKSLRWVPKSIPRTRMVRMQFRMQLEILFTQKSSIFSFRTVSNYQNAPLTLVYLYEVDYSDSYCYEMVEKLINYGEKVDFHNVLDYMQYVEDNSSYTEENVKCFTSLGQE